MRSSEAWIDGRGEVSRAELEGSIDCDVYACNWSNLVGHCCRRLRCKTSGVVLQRKRKDNADVAVRIYDSDNDSEVLGIMDTVS